ncbi:nucleotide exchange factor GrpE [Thiomicrospira sp. WB1]|uniref:nucleotide exchange factor GrpE n=1 Tax=Thiomicrospira sp. WB1 TaxID=1685380 RepID=UPI0007482DF6|nr:nucleotide exchange factor GrpE [Thiomicrospira sp. WB1]KUJ72923.1 molecular chaperone GrpE [Thiomicrospira sp. WB1]
MSKQDVEKQAQEAAEHAQTAKKAAEAANEAAEPEVAQLGDDEMSEETHQAEDAVNRDLQEMLDEARKEAESQKDLAVRTLADMENLKRRTRKDVEDAHKFGLEKFVTELLSVLDSMEMGLEAAKKAEQEQGEGVSPLVEGMEMTFKQMLDVLDKFNVERVDPKGEVFDPQLHEAMTMMPSEAHDSNTVVEVVQKGYRLNDRLVRAARVVVAQ